jgi:hypothetical protein
MLKQVFVTALTEVDNQAYDTPGDIRVENGCVYKYVKFTGTTSIAAGDALCYVATDTTDTTVDGANTALGAGIAMAAVASGAVQYGWIQIKGVATLSTALAGSPAVGDGLTVNGASAPAMTKASTANQQIGGYTVNVASKIVALDFPF